MVYLVLTFVVGAGLQVFRIATGSHFPWFIIVIHTHMGLVGWLVMLVMGVAYWMFPYGS